jgi:hypothetical protein
MLAQARPLWNALPEGALQAPAAARTGAPGAAGGADLGALWGGNTQAPVATQAQGTRPRAPSSPPPLPQAGPPRARGQRRPGAAPAAAPQRLVGPAGCRRPWAAARAGRRHGDVVAWLEQQITEHGDQTWAALGRGHAGARVAGHGSHGRPGLAGRQSTASRTWSVCCTACGCPLGDEVAAQPGPPDRSTWTQSGALNERSASTSGARSRGTFRVVTRIRPRCDGIILGLSQRQE